MSTTVPVGPQARIPTTWQMLRNVYGATYDWREQYGPTYTARVLTGDFVVTGEPELVREALRIDTMRFGTHGEVALEPMVGDRQIFSMKGAEHRRERKLLMPPFHGERMRAYAALMAEAADRQSASWEPGQTVHLLDYARAVTGEVITRAVFGVHDPARIDRYLDAIGAWVDGWKPLFILVPALRWELGGLSPWARFVAARTALETLLDEEIAARRASGERGEDILSLLLDARYDDDQPMDDRTIRDELRTLLFAGHETTMIAIGWAFHFLHRNPAALERTLAVADGDPSDLARAPWLDAVVKESMRIHPIIPAIFRNCLEPTQLGPYALDAGTRICISIVMLHSHPETFPNHQVWRPERFEERSFKPWEYMPFGGGHRRCIGAAMAEYEARIVVARTLARHRFAPVDDPAPAKVARRNVSLAPVDRVPLRYLGPR